MSLVLILNAYSVSQSGCYVLNKYVLCDNGSGILYIYPLA
jgi:hypothetical protein